MDIERLIYMANQIATNLAAGKIEGADAATAAHIRDFWEPRMRQALMHAPPDGLNAVALRARVLLQNEARS